jgi:branched-chain amino acid transport system permease protein
MAIADPRPTMPGYGVGRAAPGELEWYRAVPPAVWVLGALLLIMPLIANHFILVQILGWSFILGMIALSLMFLAGYGGMVSLVQMTVAGVAGYMGAIFGESAVTAISLFWPWWIAIPMALALAILFGTLAGALAVRTAGIYTIMITLAIATAFFYFTRQNYGIFNGYNGFSGLAPPRVLGIDWRSPIIFYYLILFWAVLAYAAVLYVARAPFGLALQGIRDNPRRMAALGYNVTAHRIAAYAFAAAIAAVAGILLTWLNSQVSPGTAGIGPVIDILVIAVIGGLRHPIGPFVGALVYVVLRTFALDILTDLGLDGARFNLLVGLGFLAIVFFSPDGLVGLWGRWRDRQRARAMAAAPRGGGR